MIGVRACLLVIAGALLAAVSVACDESLSEPTVPAVHDLGEPYQVTPFAIDGFVIAQAERVCRDPQNALPAGAQLVVVDARGGDRLLLLFAGPGVEGQCFLRREGNGEFVSEGAGSGMGGIEQPLGPNELIEHGGGSQTSLDPTGKEVTQSFALGRSGPNVAHVEIVLDTGSTVEASVNRGWFGAWWPGLARYAGFRWYDAARRPLGSTA